MKRVYAPLLEGHLKQYRQMIFLSGPRQVGKTTTSLETSSEIPLHYYFNWDNEDHRALIIDGPAAVANAAKLHEIHASLPVLLFDEIHKFRNWKRFLKGFFDTYEKKCRIMVTGSARLDIYKRGGDSLMGRIFSLPPSPPLSERSQTPIFPFKRFNNHAQLSQWIMKLCSHLGGSRSHFSKEIKLFLIIGNGSESNSYLKRIYAT